MSASAVQRRWARLRWYAARAAAMRPVEIVHRLREAGVKARWRRAPVGWDESVGDGPVRHSARLRERLAGAARIPAVSESAAAARAGRLRFFGRDWPVVDWRAGAGPAFWQHDPVTGRLWPGAETSFLDIDLRSTGDDPSGPRLGDAKYVWEPGRLQVLHPLAALAAAGDGDAAATALAILRDFAEANPPYRGIHWASGIEIALRLVGLTLLCAALGPEQLSPDDRVLVRRLVAAHAAHLHAFPSLYSSANNHRVAEGLGLFLAGMLLPDLGRDWEREGRAILEAETPRLILPDGGGAEQALVYQAFTMEMVAFAALLAAGEGRPLAAGVIERLSLGALFLRAMLDGSGHAPAIGDDDETRVIGQPPDREPRYVASIAAAIAGLTGRAELLPPARDRHLREAIFAVPEGGEPVTEGTRTFAEAGYTVIRERVAARQVHLVFDHGPLGYGTLAAHGHADALALWLALDGTQVLVDAGTHLYHSGGPTRLRLRESRSHNGLVVRGASQSRASSAFGWSSRAHASLLAATHGAEWSFTASHDGYRRRFGVDHRRRLTREPRGIAIGDCLTGTAEPLPVEIGFLLPGDLDLSAQAWGVAVSRAGTVLCRIRAPEGFDVALRRGRAEEAVRAPGFGALEDARRIVFSGRLGAAEAVTRIDFASGASHHEPVDMAR